MPGGERTAAFAVVPQPQLRSLGWQLLSGDTKDGPQMFDVRVLLFGRDTSRGSHARINTLNDYVLASSHLR
jgi:hypothetical protein